MRLKYNILWFENEQDFIDSARQGIEDFLGDLGFDLEVKSFSGSAFEESIVANEKWNLILMDYDLGEKNTGATVIEAIRKKNIPTEVIFYSSMESNVENVVNSKSFEGLYWCERDSGFDEKVKKVIELTLRKVMDVTNMRGLVMAECADIDQMMDDIIAYCHNEKDDAGKIEYRSDLIDIIKQTCVRCRGGIDALVPEGCNIDSFKDTRIFSSFHKVKAIQNVTRPYKATSPLKEYRSEFNTNSQKIIDIRNCLAHVHSEEIEGKEVIWGDRYKFDKSEAIAVRKQLRDHMQNINSIFKALKQEYEN